MLYFIFVPITIIVSILAAYFSFKLNSGSNCFLISFALNILPVWTLWSKFSKNILFDAIVYDLLLIIVFSTTLIYLTKHSLLFQNVLGLLFVAIGVLLFKWR